MNLIQLSDLSAAQLRALWRSVGTEAAPLVGTAGYRQKRWLLPVQQAIVRFMLGAEGARP